MLFSKSMGYAIRAILFLASNSDRKYPLHLDDIAEAINVPRYFLGKIMIRLVKGNMVSSIKGHHGGFFINDRTLKLRLTELIEVMGEKITTGECMLHLGQCNAEDPCPVHNRIYEIRMQWDRMLCSITIGDLVARPA